MSGCPPKVVRALEGLEGVSRVEQREKKFDVSFDPTRADPRRMVEAVQRLGYRPTQDGPIRSVVDLDGLRIEARPEAASYRAGTKGALKVKVTVKSGHRLGGEGQTSTRVSAAEERGMTFPEGEVAVAEALTGEREVSLPLELERRAKKGPRAVVVTVHFQDRAGDTSSPTRSVTVRVPVVIE